MKFKKRQREQRRQREAAERYYAPILFSPWRMAIARVAAWLAAKLTRVILRVVTKAARAAVVERRTR